MNRPTSDLHALFIGIMAGSASTFGAVELIDDDEGVHQDTFRATFQGQRFLVSVVPE